ncbi:hypothetical protein HDC90_004877 [Pedobacter sp. AK013]|uniref:hypothetical protein n=1 Tax=Pedobacter sp. AK013 TaxID=2723071 RepID=UPI00160D7EA8|nr:hypothetical protein [Pedobacter sp. AK013]MBB6240212.1 hypothetical protein [Pedobacter sp. AK013]
MDIWFLNIVEHNDLVLWKVNDQNFRVVKKGNYMPFLINENYFLFNNVHLDIFKKLHNQVSIKKVKLFDPILKKEIDIYYELNVFNSIDASSIELENSEGIKIWKFNGYVFVSGELKNELNKACDSLAFSLGFSYFA